MKNIYVLDFLPVITQIAFKCVKQKREKKSILDRRGSRSCEINYILFSNIIQRSLHSFRKVWSHQGAKNQLEMVIWKALQSSRQRPVRRSEMTLSSSLAGEGGWEGFKCPDSNNGHKGYLMWHSSPHWLRSLTWSVHIKKVSWDLKGALESSFFFSFLFSFLIQRDKVARSEHIACPKSSWKKVQNLGLNLGRWYPGSKLPAPPIRHLPSEHPPYQAELWFLKDLYKHATN